MYDTVSGQEDAVIEQDEKKSSLNFDEIIRLGELTFKFCSGLLPGQVLEIERGLAQERYVKLVTSNAIGLGVALGLDDETIQQKIADIAHSNILKRIDENKDRISKSIKRARGKLHFII